jgi:hypothetical protein
MHAAAVVAFVGVVAGLVCRSDAAYLVSLAAGGLFFAVLAAGSVVDWLCWRLRVRRGHHGDHGNAPVGVDAS